jgi:hypothetical protein
VKRGLLLLAVVSAALGLTVTPAHALRVTNDDAGKSDSVTNDLLNKIPGFGGGTTRHICVIDDKLDRSICVYIPLP